jgi:hypothetical protein
MSPDNESIYITQLNQITCYLAKLSIKQSVAEGMTAKFPVIYQKLLLYIRMNVRIETKVYTSYLYGFI